MTSSVRQGEPEEGMLCALAMKLRCLGGRQGHDIVMVRLIGPSNDVL